MNNETLSELKFLASLTSGMSVSLSNLIEEWSPDEVPLTIAFAEIAGAFVDEFDVILEEDRNIVFSKVESLVSTGNEEIQIGITTGFLEAMISLSEVRFNVGIRKYRDYLGPNSQNYIERWLAFADAQGDMQEKSRLNVERKTETP